MKTAPIVPADIVFTAGQPPRAPAFDDVYHPRAGAAKQARHVFLSGNGLPGRWQGRPRFVILETGFGLGNNFLATWQAWRDDPRRCERLIFVSIEKHPPSRDALRQAHAASASPALAQQLIDAWPPLTPNIHVIDLEGGALRLLLVLGDVEALLPQLALQADAFYLDGFAPDRNPQMWSPRVLAALARHAAPGATAATWSVARSLREGLRTGGFEVDLQPGMGGKREQCVARYAPSFVPRRAPGRQAVDTQGPVARRALVIGAGLAGAAAADALARNGWTCTVLEQQEEPAQAASGNPGGLYHGTAHADDGVHARFNRAAALLAGTRYRALIDAGAVPGQACGHLRLHPGAGEAPALPVDYVQALDTEATSTRAGMSLTSTAWFYPGGGWISPRDLCHRLLDQPGIGLQCAQRVARLVRRDDAWAALDAQDRVLGEAPVVVWAGGASQPLPALDGVPAAEPLPMEAVRGQVSWFAAPGTAPSRPLSGHGYALRLDDGRLLCGATTQPGDMDAQVRASDHADNLQRLRVLAGIGPDLAAPAGSSSTAEAPASIGGRVGWRAVAPDRLPYVGAVPVALDALPPAQRADQCRLIPRVPGLFVMGGLASRGLTWAPLAAEILVAWIEGLPMPVEADLLDAVDPARVTVRRWRRGVSGTTERSSN